MWTVDVPCVLSVYTAGAMRRGACRRTVRALIASLVAKQDFRNE